MNSMKRWIKLYFVTLFFLGVLLGYAQPLPKQFALYPYNSFDAAGNKLFREWGTKRAEQLSLLVDGARLESDAADPYDVLVRLEPTGLWLRGVNTTYTFLDSKTKKPRKPDENWTIPVDDKEFPRLSVLNASHVEYDFGSAIVKENSITGILKAKAKAVILDCGAATSDNLSLKSTQAYKDITAYQDAFLSYAKFVRANTPSMALFWNLAFDYPRGGEEFGRKLADEYADGVLLEQAGWHDKQAWEAIRLSMTEYPKVIILSWIEPAFDEWARASFLMFYDPARHYYAIRRKGEEQVIQSVETWKSLGELGSPKEAATLKNNRWSREFEGGTLIIEPNSKRVWVAKPLELTAATENPQAGEVGGVK